MGEESLEPQPADAQADTIRARNSALRLLGRREHAFSELVQKLKLREIPADIAESVVSELAEAGLQNDERFAEGRCRTRSQQGYGPVRLRAELRQKQLSDAIIRRELSGYDEFFWRTQAWQQRRRKFNEAIPVEMKERARQQRHLAHRGYTSGQIQSAFQATAPE